MTHTVVVILEAKKGEELKLESALTAVVEPSRAEEGNLEYRLHKSIDNPSIFILFENWKNQAVHQQQFSKQYIIDLGSKLESLLAKPYQVIFSSEISKAN